MAIKKQQSECYCVIGGISTWLSRTVWKHTNRDQEYGALTLYFIPITTPNAKPSCQLPILCTLSVLGVCLSPCVCCVFVIISVNSQRILLQLLFVVSHVYKLCVLLRREKWKCFFAGSSTLWRSRAPVCHLVTVYLLLSLRLSLALYGFFSVVVVMMWW